jgi:putative hydrolase of the HAD superfamily
MLAPGLPRVLLFDLDDTILRFTAGQPNFWELALLEHLPEHGDHALLLSAIERASDAFWAPVERAFWGRQNMREARREIARCALAAHGVSAAACRLIADAMTESKEERVRPFDGAIETLRTLRARGHRLALITNGSSEFQRRKLARYSLEPFFELLLIEGELGFGKPDPRVFGAALRHFGIAASATWMIGDNLDGDIAGARALGITAVWHDAYARGLPAGSPVVPDRIITSIASLIELTD